MNQRVRYHADAVIPCDGTGRIFRPGVVEVSGDTIVFAGPPPSPADAHAATLARAAARAATPATARADAHAEATTARAPARTAIDADATHGPPAGEVRDVTLSGLLLPGFVNVHCHSPMTLFRGTGENLPLFRWLHDVVWPREANMTPDDVFWGMSLAAAELLRQGVTTTCEMYFYEDAVADAVLAAGSRAVITPAALALSDPAALALSAQPLPGQLSAQPLPGQLSAPPGRRRAHPGSWWSKRIDEVVDFHARRNGDGGRIEAGFGPHAAYSVPLPVLAEIAGVARELDALFHIHVAETKEEGAKYEAAHDRSVPEALADVGALDGRVLAAHGIWLSDSDISLFRRHDVAVGHCPRSNAKLASGIAPLTRLMAEGIRVGLGTDGPASNNGLDLWEEMRFAALVARLRDGDAAALPAASALELATRGGGMALGRPELGTLAPGSPADMMLVDLDDPAFAPIHDDAHLVEHVVWSASSRLVTDVWVAGRRVVADGRCLTVDIDLARRQVEDRSRRLLTA